MKNEKRLTELKLTKYSYYLLLKRGLVFLFEGINFGLKGKNCGDPKSETLSVEQFWMILTKNTT